MDLGSRYLLVALRLRRLEPGLVESYTGPRELAEHAARDRAPSANELAAEVTELRRFVEAGALDPDRRRWLDGQLAGISTALARLSGARIGYRELFERCHGATAELVPDERFQRAHALLDGVLPGRGDVRERYRRWSETQAVPRERLLEGLDALTVELRRRTGERFGLPAGEEARFELAPGEQWAGNASHVGRLRTRIGINPDFPITSARLLELATHEAYPGHHAETVCKDEQLVAGRGWTELQVYVYPTPQALMSEGIACHAMEMLLGDEADELAAGWLRPLGIPYDPHTAAVVRAAEYLLLGIRPNIAILLDERRMSSEQARAYARRWMLHGDHLAELSVQHIEERLWPPYESCYPVGLALCRGYTGGDPRRFRELLTRQLTPAQLR